MYLLCSIYFDVVFFFFKQKTAYEMRISDWSSDVCSSDLSVVVAERVHIDAAPRGRALQDRGIREFIFENTRRAMGARFTIGRRILINGIDIIVAILAINIVL